jgi:hypothetical protein
MAEWTKQKAINLAFQQLALRRQFPNGRCWINRSELTWVGTLTPCQLTLSYVVRLRYKLNGSPRVDILDPGLQRRDGQKAPHLYEGDLLCLYLPRTGEWDRSMLLGNTIIPWASEWLLHYEIWLATGEWCGGGMHPKKG